jgi:hypothetical protein
MPVFENPPQIPKQPAISRTFIGIDNGVSGGITILNESEDVVQHIATPVKRCLNYTKKKAFINRVDFEKLKQVIQQAGEHTFAMIERPMVNPGRFAATISAMRCMEATEIIFEQLQVPYQFIDSKEWQNVLLPSGLKGDELKKAATDVTKRLYPRVKVVNADCLLIALYCKRKMSK